MKIVIFGAGRTGRALANALTANKYSVTILEEKREVCDEVAGETNATVICGDATDPELLEELELDKADYVFAVTGNEETNFLVSVYAKHVNATIVISSASEARYSHLMEKLGVEPMIPELTLARELANKVINPTISAMLDPNESKIEMREKKVDKGMEGKTVAEVNEKNKYTIVSVHAEGKFIFPNNKFALKEGMKIVTVKHNV